MRSTTLVYFELHYSATSTSVEISIVTY